MGYVNDCSFWCICDTKKKGAAVAKHHPSYNVYLPSMIPEALRQWHDCFDMLIYIYDIWQRISAGSPPVYVCIGTADAFIDESALDDADVIAALDDGQGVILAAATTTFRNVMNGLGNIFTDEYKKFAAGHDLAFMCSGHAATYVIGDCFIIRWDRFDAMMRHLYAFLHRLDADYGFCFDIDMYKKYQLYFFCSTLKTHSYPLFVSNATDYTIYFRLIWHVFQDIMSFYLCDEGCLCVSKKYVICDDIDDYIDKANKYGLILKRDEIASRHIFDEFIKGFNEF